MVETGNLANNLSFSTNFPVSTNFEIDEKKHSINFYWEYTDVYSYGMVLYELFSCGGLTPFYNIQNEKVYSKFD